MKRLLTLAVLVLTHAHAASVTLLTVPNEGVQPQALVDSKGVLHLVFLAGPAPQSDIFHTTLDPTTKTFAKPQRVNHIAGSGIATGTIRGAQCALGRNDRLHIVWNGGVTGADGKRQTNVFYTRSAGDSQFEDERPMMHLGMYLDGGCTVAADAKGNVHAMWHAAPLDTPKGTGEIARTIYVSTSHDDGQTFATETRSPASDAGVCGCCSMRAAALPNGDVFALYRSADGTGRGMQIMRSTDSASTFARTELQPWPINMCPMSSSFIQPTKDGVLAAWETDSTIWIANLADAKPQPSKVSESHSKHPSIALNERGDTLITWAIGTGWQKGGSLAWTLRDASGKVLEASQAPRTKRETQAKGESHVPMWSYPAAAFVKGLGFVVLH